MGQMSGFLEDVVPGIEERVDEPKIGAVDEPCRGVAEQRRDGPRIGDRSGRPQDCAFAGAMPRRVIVPDISLNASRDLLEKRVPWRGDNAPLLKLAWIGRFSVHTPAFKRPTACVVPMRQQVEVIWPQGFFQRQRRRGLDIEVDTAALVEQQIAEQIGARGPIARIDRAIGLEHLLIKVHSNELETFFVLVDGYRPAGMKASHPFQVRDEWLCQLVP